jgi:hypothetical protein
MFTSPKVSYNQYSNLSITYLSLLGWDGGFCYDRVCELHHLANDSFASIFVRNPAL